MTLSLSPAGEPCREFVNGAQDLVNRLTSSLRVLTHERERLKLVLETAAETNSISSRNGPSSGKQVLCVYIYLLDAYLFRFEQLRMWWLPFAVPCK